MSIRSPLNSPTLVSAAGAAVLVGFPYLSVSGASLITLKLANLTAYATNVAAVSVPGRIDGQQDEKMRGGDLNPTAYDGSGVTDEADKTFREVYSTARGRTLLSPAGWAFAIWGPIYLGEASICAAQFLLPEATATSMQLLLPEVTVPFVAANIMQSLWCAVFRPSYNEGWKKYVSVAMLGGTAFSLSHVHHAVISAANPDWTWWFFMIPTTMHFGWTTAATLVNLNGSIAMSPETSETTVIAVGHASAVAATAVGVGVTLMYASPTYGLTLAWALSACASGMKQRTQARTTTGSTSSKDDRPALSSELMTGMKVQRYLCLAGSALCCATAAVVAAGGITSGGIFT